MKKVLIAATVGMLVAGSVAAQESPWLVRARAVHLNMANVDSTGLGLTVNDKTIPEVDISYFFSKNIAAELILTVPQKQHVYSNGADLGTFKHLPPTLTVQYHFTDFTGYKPYVGAGLNYTQITAEKISAGGGTKNVTLSDKSVGGALQAGVDIPLTKQVSLNIDVKKVYLKTHVYVGGADGGTLKLDPVLFGVGVGYRF
nr:OmpW family outer membrane protein [uncultured Limnohabitans sp.]